MRWVHGVYTKGGNWSLFNAQSSASWAMKKICMVKDTRKQWVFSEISCINEVYSEVFLEHQRVKWRSLVWNSISIPKTRFCCWLLALGKLRTKDRLHLSEPLDDDLCPLCTGCKETIHHLFFKCLFSMRCLEEITLWTGIRFKSIDPMDFRKYKISKLQQKVLCVVYASTVHAIWQERNDAVWNHVVRLPSSLVRGIQQEIRLRLRVLRLDTSPHCSRLVC